MADMTKCEGKGCPLKETCYRFLVKSDEWFQSYITACYKKETDTCEMLWLVEQPKKTT